MKKPISVALALAALAMLSACIVEDRGPYDNRDQPHAHYDSEHDDGDHWHTGGDWGRDFNDHNHY